MLGFVPHPNLHCYPILNNWGQNNWGQSKIRIIGVRNNWGQSKIKLTAYPAIRSATRYSPRRNVSGMCRNSNIRGRLNNPPRSASSPHGACGMRGFRDDCQCYPCSTTLHTGYVCWLKPWLIRWPRLFCLWWGSPFRLVYRDKPT